MKTSVSRRLNILCIYVDDWRVNTVVPVKYVNVEILLTCVKHLHERIMSSIGDVWNLKLLNTATFFLLKCMHQARKVCGHFCAYFCYLSIEF